MNWQHQRRLGIDLEMLAGLRKNGQNFGLNTFVISKKAAQSKLLSNGQNSPNLVTLLGMERKAREKSNEIIILMVWFLSHRPRHGRSVGLSKSKISNAKMSKAKVSNIKMLNIKMSK
jgi:hypothetical protein